MHPILLFRPKLAEGRKKNGRSRQIAEKHALGPILAGPPRKVSMTRASFGKNHWENDFLTMEIVLKPCLSYNFKVDTPAL